MKKMWQWALPALLLVGSCGLSFAQSTNAGDIRGSVLDSTGALVPSVTVTVNNVDTGVTFTFQTNKDGIYDTSSIVAGHYKLTFTKPGFETYVRGPVTILVGNTTVNANLSVGAQTEQIVVNTDVPLLQTESGDITKTMDSKEMAQLPQAGNDWENFMILLPGTTGAANSNQGTSDPGQLVSSNGNLPYSNILADGASTTLSHSQNANAANFESVDELQVSLSSFSAQYGVGGMIINQISKGGTDHFHGSAYDYIQNNLFQSHPFSAYNSNDTIVSPQRLRYNNFGGSVGGPILKNKAFFFFNYDQTIDHGVGSSGYQDVPTLAVQGGDFTTDVRTIYDPLTQTWATDANGNSYPVRKSFIEEYGANKLPTSLLDQFATKWQTLFPTAANHISQGHMTPGYVDSMGELRHNFWSSIMASNPTKKYFGRADYTFSEKNRLNLSDTQTNNPQVGASPLTACPVGCQNMAGENNNSQISDVWVINNNTTNEARMSYTWQAAFWSDAAMNQGYAAKFGWKFAAVDSIPTIKFWNTYPYAWIQQPINAVYKQHVFDPSDVVTMTHGKHILHFGGEVLIYRDDSTAWGNQNAGSFDFDGSYTAKWSVDPKDGCQNGAACKVMSNTGIEYADLILGLGADWSAAYSPEYGARLKSPQFFFQDDYKVRPNLTVNLGLRYQINHGWNEVHGNFSTWDPNTINMADGSLGAMAYGSNRNHSLMKDVYSTFLPRVGASWQPKPNTTIRGAFGLYSYNWSLDNYGGDNNNYGLGSRLAASGNGGDNTSGMIPYVKLGGSGTIYGTNTPLPYHSVSTASTRYNGSSIGYLAYNVAVPKIWQWNVAVQRQFKSTMVAEVAYVGSHGLDLSYPTDINAVPVDHLSNNDTQFRPYPLFQGISANSQNGISNYHSLQASLNKSMSRGLQFGVSYVWSHFLDSQDSSGWGSRMGPQNVQYANNPGLNYSNSNFDVRQSLKGQAVYRLPFGKGAQFFNNNSILDTVIGGWQTSAIVILNSGQPYSVFATSDTYQHYGSQFPNRVPGVSTTPKHRTTAEWYNPAAFADPGPGHFGNMRRNQLYGPGFEETNMNASKSFVLPWEGVKIQFRADAWNAFNHTSPGEPNGGLKHDPSNSVSSIYWFDATNPQITSSQISGRNVQMTLRLTF